MFLCENCWKCWTFSILSLWNKFSKEWKPFSNTSFFYLKILANAIFPYKIPCHKSMFRQIEWVEQIGPITRNDVLSPVTSLLSWKFYFGLKTFYKKSVWCTNYITFHIHTFWKHWSSIWGFSFPLSIINSKVFQRCFNVVFRLI